MPARRTLDVGYRLVANLDPTHRGLVRVESASGTVAGVLGPDRPRLAVPLTTFSRLRQLLDYGREGVWYIWIGIDHLLFLLSLLLPAVLVFAGRGWAPAPRSRWLNCRRAWSSR